LRRIERFPSKGRNEIRAPEPIATAVDHPFDAEPWLDARVEHRADIDVDGLCGLGKRPRDRMLGHRLERRGDFQARCSRERAELCRTLQAHFTPCQGTGLVEYD